VCAWVADGRAAYGSRVQAQSLGWLTEDDDETSARREGEQYAAFVKGLEDHFRGLEALFFPGEVPEAGAGKGKARGPVDPHEEVRLMLLADKARRRAEKEAKSRRQQERHKKIMATTVKDQTQQARKLFGPSGSEQGQGTKASPPAKKVRRGEKAPE
jgi:hypothetical protein